MAMLGKGAVAMWWNIAQDQRAEFEDWHTHEHFPERLGIPGFLRGSRWGDADGGEGFFVMYELDAYETLTSDGYRSRLNAPTPWSTKMMPHHRDMVRSQCRVLQAAGGGVGRLALTVRLSPAPGSETALFDYLREVSAQHVSRAGGVAAHLLRTETPAAAPTREQQIRGGADAAADCIWVVTAYSRDVLDALAANEASDKVLANAGAQAGPVKGIYELRCAAIPADFRQA